MDTTIFLAQIWGPAILAVGIGVFFNREYYQKLYRSLQNDTLTVLVFGMFAIGLGIAQIIYHNTWESLPEVIVSFLGWGILLKGFILTIFPTFVDRVAGWEADHRLVPVAGYIMLAVGVYLTWIGYFA